MQISKCSSARGWTDSSSHHWNALAPCQWNVRFYLWTLNSIPLSYIHIYPYATAMLSNYCCSVVSLKNFDTWVLQLCSFPRLFWLFLVQITLAIINPYHMEKHQKAFLFSYLLFHQAPEIATNWQLLPKIPSSIHWVHTLFILLSRRIKVPYRLLRSRRVRWVKKN